MTGCEIGVSISALDLLKHVTEVYKVKSYTEIELAKIVEETKRFNDQLEKERYQFDRQFETIKKTNEELMKLIQDLTKKVIQQPELTAVYQTLITNLLHENTELMKKCSKV